MIWSSHPAVALLWRKQGWKFSRYGIGCIDFRCAATPEELCSSRADAFAGEPSPRRTRAWSKRTQHAPSQATDSGGGDQADLRWRHRGLHDACTGAQGPTRRHHALQLLRFQGRDPGGSAQVRGPQAGTADRLSRGDGAHGPRPGDRRSDDGGSRVAGRSGTADQSARAAAPPGTDRSKG